MITTQAQKQADDLGLVPMIGLSVQAFEQMMGEMGYTVVWAPNMTPEDKAQFAGICWLGSIPT